MPQIVQVNEAAREVILMQSVAGKQMGRAFHYDKVGSSLPYVVALIRQEATGLTPRHGECQPTGSGDLILASC